MSAPANSTGNQGSTDADPGYDASKYVSKDEYLRDIAGLRHKEIKIAVFLAIGMAIGSFNIWIIRFMQVDTTLDWIVMESANVYFAMDQIIAWLLVFFILPFPGTWIGVAIHKIYGYMYFVGYAAAGIAFMFIPEYLIMGMFIFAVSFFLLVMVLLISKIWKNLKNAVIKMQS